jgi:hypothetical protein
MIKTTMMVNRYHNSSERGKGSEVNGPSKGYSNNSESQQLTKQCIEKKELKHYKTKLDDDLDDDNDGELEDEKATEKKSTTTTVGTKEIDCTMIIKTTGKESLI